MLWFFALRASLNWGPPSDSPSMCLPCVQSLEGISQDGEVLPGGHRSVRIAFVSGLGGLSKNQMTRSRKMSLLTSLDAQKLE